MHHHFIDRFSLGDSAVHRLDARAKLVAVVGYMAVLISFDRYAVSRLAPMAVLPLAMLWFGHVPVWFALRRVAVLSPLVLMLALGGPLYDRTLQAVALGPWNCQISGGWLTAADVGVKFALGVTALTALMCTTPFALCLEAAERLGLPRMVVVELGFLYRYLFVLLDEAMRLRRARDFRGAGRAPLGRRLAASGGVIGALFTRTLDRSQRIHLAMIARGYRGPVRSLQRLKFTAGDAALLAVVGPYLFVCRCVL
jgi:cobalt/nickel transport system permease protein